MWRAAYKALWGYSKGLGEEGSHLNQEPESLKTEGFSYTMRDREVCSITVLINVIWEKNTLEISWGFFKVIFFSSVLFVPPSFFPFSMFRFPLLGSKTTKDTSLHSDTKRWAELTRSTGYFLEKWWQNSRHGVAHQTLLRRGIAQRVDSPAQEKNRIEFTPSLHLLFVNFEPVSKCTKLSC